MLEPVIPAHNTASERDVIGQIRLAFGNPLPLIIGALIGALVPLATYTVGHAELSTAGWASLPGMIVVGGCLFSAITVYKWGHRAFGSTLKAAGFVVLSEGVMTFSQTHWLSLLVLAFLIAINAVANGANLAVAHLDAEAQRLAAQTAVVAAPVETRAPVVMDAPPVVAGPVELAVKPVRAPRRRSSTKAKPKTVKVEHVERDTSTVLN